MCRAVSDWERCIIFHGHTCPGLAIGYRMAMAAKQRLLFRFSEDEDIVCVTENDACGVDAIQVLTGCSIGKGNLIYRDRGKQAYSFFKRSNGEKVRIVFKQLPNRDTMDRDAFQEYILTAPIDELFEFKEPNFSLPEMARIFKSLPCDSCGESTIEHKLRLHDGKKLCLDCFPEYTRGW